MPFTNRIRLPFITNKAQFPTERNVFRRADGSTKVLSSVVRNTYQLTTDYLPEKWHKRLVIALSHDSVTVENEIYLGGIVLDADYSIDWQEFLNYPVAQANTTIQVTPFDATNSNCQTCEQATQLSLVDDKYPGIVEEGNNPTTNVLVNDSICCYPSTAELVSFNTDFLTSATLSPDGNLTITLKPVTGSGTDVKVATYRVTCPDGSYDEADVFADIEGSAVACNPPGNPVVYNVTYNSVSISWPAASPVPDSYLWKIVLASNPSIILGSGTTDSLFAVSVGLSPGTDYIFVLNSSCGGGAMSSTLTLPFSTLDPDPEQNNCGKYEFYRPGNMGASNISYKDCDGNFQTQTITAFSIFTVCMLESAPGVPDDSFATSGGIAYEYIGPC